MSIFFNDRRVKPVVPPAPTPEQIEEALVAVSQRKPTPIVASILGTMELAAHLHRQCVAVEPLLIEQIASDAITTQTAAVQFVRDNTTGWFPAVKFITVCKDRCSPQTWVGFVAACKEEVA